MTEFSIIIPYYNAYHTIERAISSVEDYFENYNFELLIVNDGSEDNFASIQEKYEKKDNIYFYSQKNLGVSSARNLGLKMAKGKYIGFLDADDSFFDLNVDRIIKEFNLGAEMVCFGYDEISTNGDTLSTIKPNRDLTSTAKKLIYPEIIRSHSVGGHVHNKFFLNHIIKKNNLKFQKVIDFAEDLVFVVEYLEKIDKISTISSSMYHLMISSLSIRGSVSKPTKTQLLKLSSVVVANEFISKSQLDRDSIDWFKSESFYMFMSLLANSKKIKGFDDEAEKKMKCYKRSIRPSLTTFMFSQKNRFSFFQRTLGLLRYIWY